MKISRIIILLLAFAVIFWAGEVFACDKPDCPHKPHKGKGKQVQKTTVINNNKATANSKSTSISKAAAEANSASSATVGDITTDVDITAGGEGAGAELSGEEFRQFPITQELEFPDSIQPVRSNDRPKNIFPLEIDQETREKNLKRTFPTRLTLKEAKEWLGDDKVEAIVKSPWHLRYQMGFCDLMDRIPENAKYIGNIYLFADKKNITTDAVMAKAFEASMESGRNAFTIQYFDSTVVPTGDSKGIALGSNGSGLAGAGKDMGYSSGLMLGWTKTKLQQLGYPQAIVTMFQTECKETGGKIVCPEPSASPPPPVPKPEVIVPKPEPPKEIIKEKIVEVPVEVNPFEKLPEIPPIYFELNSSTIKDFTIDGVRFENQKALQEAKAKMKEKILPLMQKDAKLKIYFVGSTCNYGPSGTFRTQTKEGKKFSNNEAYNNTLGKDRAQALGLQIVQALGISPERTERVSKGIGQPDIQLDELKRTGYRSAYIMIGYRFDTATSLSK